MITPEQVEMLARPLVGVYAAMEADLLTNVAEMVARGLPTAGQDFDWYISKMQETGALHKKNIAVISRMSGKTAAEVERIIKEAGYQSLELSEAICKDAAAAGLTVFEALPITASQQVQQVLLAAVRNAKDALNLVNTTALNSADEAFLKIINQVYLETSLGYYSYQDSIFKAVREFADTGITGMVYRSAAGRLTRTTPDVAVRRAILTSSAQTAGKLQIVRADEWGATLVEVSSHWGARPEHAEWQGKIYRIHGSDAKHKNLAEATGYGTGGGLCGYNCRHVFYPFWEGISEQRYRPYAQAENERRYDDSQEQRAIERDLRQQKRREAAAAAVGDADGVAAARAKIAERDRAMKQLMKDTGRVRRKDREAVA